MTQTRTTAAQSKMNMMEGKPRWYKTVSLLIYMATVRSVRVKCRWELVRSSLQWLQRTVPLTTFYHKRETLLHMRCCENIAVCNVSSITADKSQKTWCIVVIGLGFAFSIGLIWKHGINGLMSPLFKTISCVLQSVRLSIHSSVYLSF